MAATYRVGVIGCGGMGGVHTDSWTNNSRTEVVALADVSREAAQNLAEPTAACRFWSKAATTSAPPSRRSKTG